MMSKQPNSVAAVTPDAEIRTNESYEMLVAALKHRFGDGAFIDLPDDGMKDIFQSCGVSRFYGVTAHVQLARVAGRHDSNFADGIEILVRGTGQWERVGVAFTHKEGNALREPYYYAVYGYPGVGAATSYHGRSEDNDLMSAKFFNATLRLALERGVQAAAYPENTAESFPLY